MKPVFTIFISEPNFFRRYWLKKTIKKMTSDFDKIANTRIITCRKLTDVVPKMVLVGIRNIYFLTADLSNEQELETLQKIKRKNSQGNIVLFIPDAEHLNALFRYKIPVLDYQEINKPKSECFDFIQSTYYFILKQLGYDFAIKDSPFLNK